MSHCAPVLQRRSQALLMASIAFAVFADVQTLPAAPPSVERVVPITGQRGTTFELTVAGAGLDTVETVVFYRSGLRCVEINADSPTSLRIVVEASEQCERGSHPFRMVSKEGFSELRTIQITTLPVIPESEDNSQPETAESIPLNSTVAGTIEAGDSDFYRCNLRKGDRLTVEAEAIRAGGTMFDAVVNIFHPDGTWILSKDDASQTRQDPYASLIADADGDYLVQIMEAAGEGDENSVYALHIGSFSRPGWVFPVGGPAGSKLQVEFGGIVSEGRSASAIQANEVELPATENQTFSITNPTDGVDTPISLPFRVSPFGNRLEQEPNDTVPNDVASNDETRGDAIPIALNGRLASPGDVDHFQIRGEAGQVVSFEVYSARVGSPADTILTVRDAGGKLIGRSDDGISHDSHLVQKLPETGVYTVSITDKRGNGGEDFIYRVEVTEFKPQLTAFLTRPDRRSQDQQTVCVPQGNRVLTWLACQRTGFSGDVHLSCSGLPGGVRMSDGMIPEDRFWVPIVVEAAPDAPISNALVNVEASAELPNGSIQGSFRQIVDLVAASADQLFQAAEVDRLAMAVVEPAGFAIELLPPTAPLSPNGTLDVVVKVHREPGFDGAVDVSLPLLPPWVDGPASIRVESGADRAVYSLRAWPEAAPRNWKICAEGKARLATGDSEPAGSETAQGDQRRGGRRRSNSSSRLISVCSELVDLEIAASPVSGLSTEAVAAQGTRFELTCPLEKKGTLPAQLTASLEGLPNRVTAKSVELSGDQTAVTFEVICEPTAPIGEFEGIAVRLSGSVDDQAVSWQVGTGTRLRIVQPEDLVKGADGRPLTRLEILRRKTAD